MNKNMEYDYLIKILLIGSCREDKSKLLLNILDNNCDKENNFTTIGVDFVRINK